MSENILKRSGTVWGGAFLIAGTSIGAGMLALPFVTGVAGFGPAMFVNTLCWLYMLCTGLLFLEVTLWMPDGANVLSMTRRFLGRGGWIIGGAAFLFLYYSLLVGYFSGGAPIFAALLRLPLAWGYPLFGILLALVVFLGHHATDRVNFILMTALIFAYLGIVGLAGTETRIDPAQWPLAWLAIPTLFAAYGYHNIVPSVATYLRRDVRKIQWAIILGTAIPFLIYAIWQWVIIGMVPRSMLAETLASRQVITHVLQLVTESRVIPVLVQFFALFAITTSILGVALSFVDFLGDGTGIPRWGWGRLLLTLLVFAPPFLLAWAVPGLFFVALEYAGAFGEAILNGLLPVLMVWIGRYHLGLKSERALPGGRPLLALLLAVALAVIVTKII